MATLVGPAGEARGGGWEGGGGGGEGGGRGVWGTVGGVRGCAGQMVVRGRRGGGGVGFGATGGSQGWGIGDLGGFVWVGRGCEGLESLEMERPVITLDKSQQPRRKKKKEKDRTSTFHFLRSTTSENSTCYGQRPKGIHTQTFAARKSVV